MKTELRGSDPFELFETWRPEWKIVDREAEGGAYLRTSIDRPACYQEFGLGRVKGLKRFTGGFRHRPFWMKAQFGTKIEQVEWETQWLLMEVDGGKLVLMAPLLDGGTRFSLRGSEEGIVVCAETGDPQVMTTGGVALWIGFGDDPFDLVKRGARAGKGRVGGGRLREEKKEPDFVDLFGWCTWDAFYREVSAEQVRAGLESFAAGGVQPRWMILDDGWQSVETAEGGEERLVSLAPNERFGGDLASVVWMAKQEFRIERFLVWHALMGYWGGLDEERLANYEPRTVARAFGPGILKMDPSWNVRPWGAVVGVPSARKIAAFYDDYHRSLAAQGVDGVKVDNQAMLEAVSAGQGGRVALARAYRTALEASVGRHFGGRLINCMSCTMEAAYLAAESTVLRTSDDFYPARPETHGEHVLNNAHTSLWFGEFILPDWDMFQSAHAAGAFHAAARAVSGGPVYVSDKPGAHDFALMRKLVLTDGTVLRADQPGRPTRDSLFADPRNERVLFKVFNRNGDAGIVGLFNVQHRPGAAAASCEPIEGRVAPKDVEGLAGETFAGLAHRSGLVWTCGREETATFRLAEWEGELVSFVPIQHGFAALGLADKFNSTGAVLECAWAGTEACCVRLRDGGGFVGWAGKRPRAVECDGQDVACDFDEATGRVACQIPTGGERTLWVRW